MQTFRLPHLDVDADVTLTDLRSEDKIAKSLAEHGGSVRVTRAGVPLGVMVSINLWKALQTAEATFAQLQERYEEMLEEATIVQFVREREADERTPGTPERANEILAAFQEADSRLTAVSASASKK